MSKCKGSRCGGSEHFITASAFETLLSITSLLGGPSSASGEVATVVAGEDEPSAVGEKEASRERLPMIVAVWEPLPGRESCLTCSLLGFATTLLSIVTPGSSSPREVDSGRTKVWQCSRPGGSFATALNSPVEPQYARDWLNSRRAETPSFGKQEARAQVRQFATKAVSTPLRVPPSKRDRTCLRPNRLSLTERKVCRVRQSFLIDFTQHRQCSPNCPPVPQEPLVECDSVESPTETLARQQTTGLPAVVSMLS